MVTPLPNMRQSLASRAEARWLGISNAFYRNQVPCAHWIVDDQRTGTMPRNRLSFGIRCPSTEGPFSSRLPGGNILTKYSSSKMTLQHRNRESVVVELTIYELGRIVSALGESIECIDDWEFETRMGATKAEIWVLIEAFNALAANHE